MENLTLRIEPKKMARQSAAQNDPFDVMVGSEELLKLFPLPRYFQVHFGHIHESTEHVKTQVEELKQTVDRVERKLDRILAVLMPED